MRVMVRLENYKREYAFILFTQEDIANDLVNDSNSVRCFLPVSACL